MTLSEILEKLKSLEEKGYGDAEVMLWTNPTGGGEFACGRYVGDVQVEDNAGPRDNPCVVGICEDDGEE